MFYVFPLQGIRLRRTCFKKNGFTPLEVFGKNKKDRPLTGFTLLEVLMVIAIIIVFSTLTVVSFNTVREQLALKRAAHQMVQDLRRAQEMAMSSAEFKETENCYSPLPTAKGYGIYLDIPTSNKSYKLYADTAADTGLDCETYFPTECWEYYNSADCVVETINIQEKGVIIKEIKNTDGGVQKVSINFKPPNPSIKIKWLLDNINEVEIVLALESEQSKTKTVVVNRTGLLEIR